MGNLRASVERRRTRHDEKTYHNLVARLQHLSSNHGRLKNDPGERARHRQPQRLANEGVQLRTSLDQIFLVDLLPLHGRKNFLAYLLEKGRIMYQVRDEPEGEFVEIPYQADADLARYWSKKQGVLTPNNAIASTSPSHRPSVQHPEAYPQAHGQNISILGVHYVAVDSSRQRHR